MLIAKIAVVLSSLLTFHVAHNSSASSLHVSKALMNQARWVNHCEENGYGWHVNGSEYQGGLGWLNATWLQFKTPAMPVNMADASPLEQAFALSRFAAKYGMPDLDGKCAGY